jgi:hypothetical protein
VLIHGGEIATVYVNGLRPLELPAASCTTAPILKEAILSAFDEPVKLIVKLRACPGDEDAGPVVLPLPLIELLTNPTDVPDVAVLGVILTVTEDLLPLQGCVHVTVTVGVMTSEVPTRFAAPEPDGVAETTPVDASTVKVVATLPAMTFPRTGCVFMSIWTSLACAADPTTIKVAANILTPRTRQPAMIRL